MLKIISPFHGAVLNRRHGRASPAGLTITVSGDAPLGDRVTVNGVMARRAGTTFTAEIPLAGRETEIAAASEGVSGKRTQCVRVLWDRNSRPRYRVSMDDNCFFLREIARTRPASLFDNFYLSLLQRLHRDYGTRFVLNLFYTTPESDFTLADFPETYKTQWRENSAWLKLSFHAYAEFPDRPYQYAAPEKLAADFDLLADEVLRFAGEDTWSPPTVIHWAMVHPRSMSVLVKRGVKVLSGFFVPNTGQSYTADGGEQTPPASSAGYDVNYLLDPERSEYLSRHDALMDWSTGIVYSHVDIVCNNTPVDRVVPTLEPLTGDPDNAEIMDLFTHEQYFWPFYRNFRPDHAERLERAIRFVSERGYAPVFFHEGFLGV